MHALIDTAGYQHANYFSFDENQKTLSLLGSVGFAKEHDTKLREKLVFKIGEEKGLVGVVAQTGQIINIADTSMEPRWLPLDMTIQSALFVPVHFEKTLLGVAGLFSKETGAFNQEDEQNIASLLKWPGNCY